MATAVAKGGSFAELTSSDASMSHSREKVNLCCEIILDHFGAVEAQVACTLLQRGRLSLRELSRFLATPTLHAPTGYVAEPDDVAQEEPSQGLGTDVVSVGGRSAMVPSAAASTSATSWSTPLRSQRLIQYALLTLVQHNICWHTQTALDGTPTLPGSDAQGGQEFFEINVEEILPRLRIGTFRKIGQDCYGKVGEIIVCEVLRYGKRRISDVIQGVISEHPDLMQEEVEDTLRDLLYYAYIQPSTPAAHMAPRDRHITYDTKLTRQRRTVVAKKEAIEIARQATALVTEDARQVWFDSKQDDQASRRGLVARTSRKRGANGTASNGRGNGKKAKTNDGKARKSALLVQSSDDEDGDKIAKHKRQNLSVDPALFVRINYDRFDVHIRNELVVRSVASRYNTQLASLVRVMLKNDRGSYERIVSSRDEHSSSIHVSALRQRMSGKQLRLCDALDEKQVRKKHGSDASMSDSALVGEAIAILLADEDSTDPSKRTGFLGPSLQARTNTGLGGFSQVQVEYRNAVRIMRQQILHNVIMTQFGTSGTRVVRVLREKGKLNEAHVSKECLISMSDTRDVCGRLMAAGLLSLQEVPKSSERVALRTLFYWFVDERKCFAWLADRLYKTLARLAQRKRKEQAREAALLVKVQQYAREDEALMVGGTGHALLQVERLRLQHVRDTVNLLTLAETKTWQDLFVTAHLPE